MRKKRFIIIIRKYFNLKNFASLKGKVKQIFDFETLQVTSWNIRSFFRVGSFYFKSSESYFLEYKKFFKVSVSWNIISRGGVKSSISRNVRSFFRVSVSWIFLILEPRSSISWNIRNFFARVDFFDFPRLGWKVR